MNWRFFFCENELVCWLDIVIDGGYIIENEYFFVWGIIDIY